MSISLADQFYLKALDNYPFDIEEVVEKLNYAHGYDDEHAGIHCLFGRLHYEQLQQFDAAIFYFEQALAFDPQYAPTYIHYPTMLMHLGEHEKALKLIRASFHVRGLSRSNIFYREAQVHEASQQLVKAKESLEKAVAESLDSRAYEFMKAELKRVETKINPPVEEKKEEEKKEEGRKVRRGFLGFFF